MNHLDLLDLIQTLDVKLLDNQRGQQQLQARLADDGASLSAQQAFDVAAEHEREWRARLRLLDLEVKGLDDQIQNVQARLYGGKVMNPKELSGLERDEGMLKRQKSDVEDQMLEAMAQIEQVETEVRDKRATLDRVLAQRANETTQDRDKLAELQATAARLEQARQEARAQIPPADLQVYDSLFAEKKGRAVTHIKGSSCEACGFVIPSGIASRARVGQEIIFCANCGRILLP